MVYISFSSSSKNLTLTRTIKLIHLIDVLDWIFTEFLSIGGIKLKWNSKYKVDLFKKLRPHQDSQNSRILVIWENWRRIALSTSHIQKNCDIRKPLLKKLWYWWSTFERIAILVIHFQKNYNIDNPLSKELRYWQAIFIVITILASHFQRNCNMDHLQVTISWWFAQCNQSFLQEIRLHYTRFSWKVLYLRQIPTRFLGLIVEEILPTLLIKQPNPLKRLRIDNSPWLILHANVSSSIIICTLSGI